MPRPAGPVWEPLSEEVRRTLDLLLPRDTPAHRAYRAQLPHTEMAEGCTCPCGSLHLRVDRTAVPPAPPRGDSPVVAAGSVATASGKVLGEALVFDWTDGYLDELEFALWEADAVPRPLWEWVRPYGHAAAQDPPRAAPARG
ncbi:hypothetical protein [Streptomyces sp. WAC06614]|uniref:hypothetical protein n=1 Tax=Streptomyces sp. WAC06614 TaxID=2487416 RepID=UPI000F77CF0F|nr:hypothetical protein [Streptomyces sp. WAC06614]RSS83514.1 hypothetical protein EF918_03380 [Streptomyces sp. WAC06614]